MNIIYFRGGSATLSIRSDQAFLIIIQHTIPYSGQDIENLNTITSARHPQHDYQIEEDNPISPRII